jgi:hypothetical protein
MPPARRMYFAHLGVDPAEKPLRPIFRGLQGFSASGTGIALMQLGVAFDKFIVRQIFMRFFIN